MEEVKELEKIEDRWNEIAVQIYEEQGRHCPTIILFPSREQATVIVLQDANDTTPKLKMQQARNLLRRYMEVNDVGSGLLIFENEACRMLVKLANHRGIESRQVLR